MKKVIILLLLFFMVGCASKHRPAYPGTLHLINGETVSCTDLYYWYNYGHVATFECTVDPNFQGYEKYFPDNVISWDGGLDVSE